MALPETRVKVRQKVALPEMRVKVRQKVVAEAGLPETRVNVRRKVVALPETRVKVRQKVVAVAGLPETRVKVRQKVVAVAGSLSPGAAEMSTWKRTLRENMEEPPPRRYSARNVEVDTTLWLRSGV